MESLRSICVTLARLQNDFSDTEIGDEPYFKIEDYMPVEKLTPLKQTFCPMERKAMMRSAQILVQFYAETARSLSESHHVRYPEILEGLMRKQLTGLQEI